MRDQYNEQLASLNKELSEMGGMCENAMAMAVKAMLDKDWELAGEVPALSYKIVLQEREIVQLCMLLLMKQQPVAADLRCVSSALKMVTDIKRIGDQSADIAEIVALGNISNPESVPAIRPMALAAIKMVTDSVAAFIDGDAELAREVIKCDDAVDNFFDNIKHRIAELFSDPETDGECAIDLLMISKYLERIADHAVNIAGWVLFSVTGQRGL